MFSCCKTNIWQKRYWIADTASAHCFLLSAYFFPILYADSNEFSETEQSQKTEDIVYDLEKYGEIETARQEFSPEENGELTYYFELEKFYAKDSVVNYPV